MIGSSSTLMFHSLHYLPMMCNGEAGAGASTAAASSSSSSISNGGIHPLEQAKENRLQADKQMKNQEWKGAGMIEQQPGEWPKWINENYDPEAPFANLPPPPDLAPGDSFAACLKIKDDNHWLIEWLAYHYFVMPLRHIIVTIDEDSKTTPRKIFRRWSSRKMMNITYWTDKDYMPKKITATAADFENNTGLMMHRVRQNNFYRTCIPALRDMGLNWLMLVDTDEYILPSYASGYFSNLTERVSFRKPGSVMRLLKYQEMVAPDVNHTCVYMPRFFFGAQDSKQSLVNHGVPPSINASNMLTQRYLYREPRKHANGKNLMHLQRVPAIKKFMSVHHVSTHACPDPKTMVNKDLNRVSIARVHHYLGSPEQYLYREDPRGNYHANASVKTYHTRGLDRWDKLNRKADHEDHAAKAWIRGFVKEMGEELAADLLEGVGVTGVE